MEEKIIYVYADFLPFQKELIGKLFVSQTRGNEFCSFEYDANWLQMELRENVLWSRLRVLNVLSERTGRKPRVFTESAEVKQNE